MKSLSRIGLALVLFAGVSGCVYDPGYSYVRPDGYYGDAYYGTRYAPAYYDYGYGYAPGYYGYYGYAYPAIGFGLRYSDRYYRGGRYDRGHDYRGHGDRGHYHDGHDRGSSHGRHRDQR